MKQSPFPPYCARIYRHERLIATDEPIQRSVLICKIEVWDWDKHTEHDEIGMAEVNVMPFVCAAHRGSYRGSLGKTPQPKSVSEHTVAGTITLGLGAKIMVSNVVSNSR